jgi:Disulphide bond corrector protein DsbC
MKGHFLTNINRRTMRKIITLTIALFCAQFTYAQMSEPVSWSFTAEKINESDYEITLTANIESGWYVYSQDLPKRGPVPTQIKFDSDPNIVYEGKPTEVGTKKEDFDANFNMPVVKLTGRTKFVQKAKLVGGVPVVHGQLKYMTCNGEMCMPPKNVEFKIILQ